METYIAIQHWGAIVRDMKDAEKEHDIPAYTTECLARDILYAVRNERLRQPVLFQQHRGQEYDTLIETLKAKYDPALVDRTVSNEEFWTTTFTL
jgi:hypothetical protein